MKCPNCGEEIAEGYLYCSKCGEDIHIVPDFEPELDQDIQQTIKNITDDIWVEPRNETNETKEMDWDGLNKHETNRQKKSHRIRIVLLIMGIVVLTITGASGVGWWMSHSSEYQMNKARAYAEAMDYTEAVMCYKRAMELDEDNITIKIELADVYFLQNDRISYETLLKDIVADGGGTKEQMESTYGKLIAIYRSRNDNQAINDLLLASNNEELMSTYQSYVAVEPQFSIQEGYYNSLQPLKISTFGSAKIYYTLDGSEPDENSTRYTIPLLLDDGEYLIKAVSISENGIRSNTVKKEYHITIDELPSPEISVMTGDYEFPVNIEVLDEGEPVYYTIDGTIPTEKSALYTGPIPMPLGKSEFQFIRIGNGRKSVVEKRNYKLTMNTEFTPKEAVESVVAYCLETDRIDDEAGYSDDADGRYLFLYQYVTNINGVNDFYVIKESLQDKEGNIYDTGIHYAVNAYTKEIFHLQINGPNYNLVEIER
ncbi:MAG: chitobiase/beta-hexosaminidase C-terminal domain-containing protein [Lachnospiraceae bacterium]|nr:chitobiase/beta-hexosaminidase C-terminal domain-containing protein [Lachnospiraceae bacterium]